MKKRGLWLLISGILLACAWILPLIYACIALSKADIIGGAGVATILLFPRLIFGPFLTTVLYALTAAWFVWLIVFLMKRAKNNRP